MSVFDKRASEWTEADLLALITGEVEESLQLDYKRCKALVDQQKTADEIRNELSKDVASFANSDGGTIVYGMIERDNKPTELDEGFDPATTKKEWLEDVIHGRVHPKIEGLSINSVPLSGQRRGKVAYVISVPQSTTGHQAGDKKYYKRYNFKAEPMEDYEVRDAMNRLKFPRLIPRFTARYVDRKGQVFEYALNVTIKNEGAKVARLWKLVLWIPRVLSVRVRGFHKQELVEIDSSLFGKEWFKQAFVAGDRVIFPDDEWSLSDVGGIEFVYKIDTSHYDRDEKRGPFLLWRTYADDMPPLTGEVYLADVSRQE
jgi:schlafen family protein